AKRRQCLPGSRDLGRKFFRRAAGDGRGLDLLAQPRARGEPLEAPAMRVLLLRDCATLGHPLFVPLLALRVTLRTLLVLLRALLVAPREYRVGGGVEARPQRLLLLAPEVGAGLPPGLLQ